MTVLVFPFNDPTKYAYEDAWSRMATEWLGNGVVSRVSAADCKPFGDNSGMAPKMSKGMVAVQGFYYWTDSTVVFPAVQANPGTLKRIDRMVLELNILTKTIVPKVIKGTSATSPVPPALVQQAPTGNGIWQEPIGYVDVPAGAGAPGNPIQGIASGFVRDDRNFADTRVDVFTSSDRASAAGLFRLGLEVDTGRLLAARNDAWQVLVDPNRFAQARSAVADATPENTVGRYTQVVDAITFTPKSGQLYEIDVFGNFKGSTPGTSIEIGLGNGVISGEPELIAWARYPIVYGDTLQTFHFKTVRPLLPKSHTLRIWFRKISTNGVTTGSVTLHGLVGGNYLGFSVKEWN